ncbi:MAG: ferredoxin--NADP reductase, partial [Myxococcales bacterium]|nr:ferredoxin--NADP reductase [Myxococcales bacterium]
MLPLRLQPSDRRLGETLQQLGRDLRTVFDGWRGRPAAPFTLRDARAGGRPAPAPGPDLGAREVEVVERIQECADAVTLVLADPRGGAFEYEPGAFFTLLLEEGGEELRRAYSASSIAGRVDRLALTIKRVDGGRVSTYLNDQVKVGDRLRLLGPSGAFTITPEAAAARRLVLIGGGSGITPLMAMIRALLAVEAETEIALIYGNREPRAIIFREALADLAAAHPGRLHLRHVVEADGDEPGFVAARGRLDRDGLTPELAALPWPKVLVDGWYVCGPEPMLHAARVCLDDLEIAGERRHEERFTAPRRRGDASTRAKVATPVTIRRRGEERGATVIVPPGATLLEAARAAGQDLPFSCAVGGCGACRVKVVVGDVAMDEPNCLTAEERAAGFALTCCGAPAGPCTIEVA